MLCADALPIRFTTPTVWIHGAFHAHAREAAGRTFGEGIVAITTRKPVALTNVAVVDTLVAVFYGYTGIP